MRRTGRSNAFSYIIFLLILAVITGCQSTQDKRITADLVLKSSAIYTVASEEIISGGIAVSGNRILAVTDEDKIESYIGEHTIVKDMGDQLILPGLIEGHTHTEAAYSTVGVNLTGVDSKDKIGEMVKSWADTNPDEPWVIGGGWYAANWGGEEPRKEELDKYITDRPVFLIDLDYHAGWFNSKALEIAGITKDNAEELSVDGEVVTDPETGEPTGFIKDHPMFALMDLPPDFSEIEYLENTISLWSELGITSVNEMSPWNEVEGLKLKQLKQLEEENQLNVRQYIVLNIDESVENIELAKKLFNSDVYRFTSLKTLIDGVGATQTAAMLKPYVGSNDWTGEIYWTEDDLTEAIKRADTLDLDVHIHTCGDLAIRTALNAYERAYMENGEKDRRSSIEHLDSTHPDDLPRLNELGIIANITPDFLAPTAKWKDNPYLKVYDDEVIQELWNTGSMVRSGAIVTFGTDWTTSTLNPMVQIYRAVARVANDGMPEGGFLPEEKITVQEAIRCYTYNPAYEARMEDKLGTLEAGKLADIAVLDTNILTCPVEDIFTTKAVLTVMDGRIVFER